MQSRGYSLLASISLSICIVVSAQPSAHADITRGSEFEMNEGVAAYKLMKKGKKRTMDPKVPLNERFLCSTDMSVVAPSWPLISFTHDMGWGEPTRARTLEIVTGPIADNDAVRAGTQGTVFTNVYRYLNNRRVNNCDQSVSAGFCFVSLTDIEANVAGLKEDCGGDFLADDDTQYDAGRAGVLVPRNGYSRVNADASSQTTIGVTTADLIDVDPDRLFSKHTAGNDRTYGTKLFRELQAEIKKSFKDKDKREQGLLLYATYAIIHFYENTTNIPFATLGRDGYHAPDWKNAFALYPKTAVQAVIGELPVDDGYTSKNIYDLVVANVDTKIGLAQFRELWRGSRHGNKLDQAKPSDNVSVMLFEVRDPAEDLIQITNGGNPATMTVQIPALAF